MTVPSSPDVSPHSDATAEVMHGRLQALLMSSSDIEQTLQELALLAAETLPGQLSCGITLRYDGDLVTVGSSDGRADKLDETQYHNGFGPCLTSMHTGQIIDSPDTTAESRWPDYIRAALAEGLRCSLSLPLTVGSDTLGALNIYGFGSPGLFAGPVRRRLELLAAQGAGTLHIATRRAKDAALLQQMEEALLSRTVIDQALGIIMAQQQCSAEDAFGLLRRQSQTSNRRLREVAADLVSRVSGQRPQQGRPFDAG